MWLKNPRVPGKEIDIDHSSTKTQWGVCRIGSP